MEIRHLKMINEVAHYKSLTKAAEKLYLSQSAVSHQLKEIESYFNVRVFIRQKKQMLLTKEGQIILSAGKKILDEVETTRSAIKNITNHDAGEIRFCSECYTSYHWISPALVEFRKKYPGVDFKLEIEATSDTLSYLLNDKIDVGIFEDNKSNKAIYTPLFSDEFFVIVPARHKWASHKYLHAGQLSHEPYIMYDIPLEKSTISKLILKNISPSKVYKFPLTEVIFEMVKAGFGFTIMPNWVGLNYLKAKELKAIRISKNGIRRTWYAGVLKGKDIPPYVQSFIDMLVKQKAAVNT